MDDHKSKEHFAGAIHDISTGLFAILGDKK
jgi:hypothetical protein